MRNTKASPERLRRRLELRRSSAATRHVPRKGSRRARDQRSINDSADQ